MKSERLGLIMIAASVAAVALVMWLAHAQQARQQAAEVSSLALLALPVFLLTAVCWFLVRRELRPLAAIGARIGELGAAAGQPTEVRTLP